MENERTQNKLIFLTAISDVFRDDEDRELNSVGKVEMPEDGDLTNVITDLFFAFQTFFNMITNHGADSIEFISILTRLVCQDQLLRKEDSSDEEARADNG